MSWEKILKEDEDLFTEWFDLEIRDFTEGPFGLKKFIERIEKVKTDKELYSVIKDLKEEVDAWAFNMEKDMKRRPSKSDFPDSEARPEFAREHREERL